MISITLEGPSEETFHIIENEAENVRQAIRQTFFQMGREIKKKAIKAINDKKGKTGRVYMVRTTVKSGHNKGKLGRRRRHRASAPGETHANLSGDLRDSLGWQVHGTDSMEIGYGVTKWVGKASDYAGRIEFGDAYGPLGRGVGRIEARPSIRNAIDGASFETFFEKALEKLARK